MRNMEVQGEKHSLYSVDVLIVLSKTKRTKKKQKTKQKETNETIC